MISRPHLFPIPVNPHHSVMFSLFLTLLAGGGSAAAAPTPINLGFEDLATPFPSGWNPTGNVAQSRGLVSPIAASLAAGASLHQDFAPTPADGLVTFSTSFVVRLDGSGSISTNTSRICIRGNDNVGDLITLRFTSTGIQCYVEGSWMTIIPFANQLGTNYTVTIDVANLDADPSLEYRVSCADATTSATSAVQNGWHGSQSPSTLPFETIRFESGSGNTLTVDQVLLPGFSLADQKIVNPGFEVLPFPASWTSSGGTLSVAGLHGTTTAARLPYNTSALLSQSISALPPHFTADVSFQIAGTNEAQAFRWQINDGLRTAVDLRTTTTGILQVNLQGNWLPLLKLTDNTDFRVPANQVVRLRVVGRNFGTPQASYDVSWSDPGSTNLTHAATQITTFASDSAAATSSPGVVFLRDLPRANSFVVDDVTLLASASTSPNTDFSLVLPTPPPPDKIVNISGVYPHLAMTNTHSECGVGAVVPWAGKLWVITYGPHIATGGSDRLYEIAPDLSRIIRPESVGGTPANRFIHQATNQLNIGPYFIDADRKVRVLPPSVAPGRITATAAHLSDPNRLYLFTMEDGVYDVNASDLSMITRYPDVQKAGDRFLFGYHGKGAYTGQGLFVVANNGRPNNQSVPTGPAGVLATWNGTTVAQNGGLTLPLTIPIRQPRKMPSTPSLPSPTPSRDGTKSLKSKPAKSQAPAEFMAIPILLPIPSGPRDLMPNQCCSA